jgi:GNAT superfamily N-acetyltransferase
MGMEPDGRHGKWLDSPARRSGCPKLRLGSGESGTGYNECMLKIRPATEKDVELILQFIRDLAEYEREPQAAIATPEDIIRDGFRGNPKFRVLIAEWDGVPAGFAFFFFNYSTWLGKPGLFLEDLFVKPELRGKGIGKALLAELAKIALAENCYGMKWEVLDWNQPAIDFYESLDAKLRKEWITVRLMGQPMERLALQTTKD